MPPNKDYDPDYPKKPSLRNLTDVSYGIPASKCNPALKSLGTPHVESFNFMLKDGLQFSISDLEPVEFSIPDKEQRIKFVIKHLEINPPMVAPGAVGIKTAQVYPTEARQRGISYKGRIVVTLQYYVNGIAQPSVEKSLGSIPIMVMSNACNLAGYSPRELIERGEQEQEWGGYFIVGGHERIIRMLQTTRRNYPIAMSRPSWKDRGKNFSSYGVLLECGKPDLTTTKNVLHFVNTGTAKYMFSWNKELFFVPVVMLLKCLSSRSDADIYKRFISGMEYEDDHYYKSCLKNMLAEPQEEGLFSPDQIRAYIGRSFRDKLRYSVPEWYTDDEICDFLLRKSVCVHLENNEDKFELIVFMIQKLFALVQDKCVVEGVDSVMMHEVVVGGHLYLQLLKEKLESWMISLKAAVLKKAQADSVGFELTPSVMTSCLSKTITFERIFENFIATGNLPSKTGLGLMQNKGLTIMAENINRMRYMSHFRAIHRGSFFQEMRTTEVRALLPDAWGFVCPVHTPDGSPCGLLNHLAVPVEIVTHISDTSKVPEILYNFGVMKPDEAPAQLLSKAFYRVLLDGRILGYLAKSKAKRVVDKLRILKVKGDCGIPRVAEIVLVEFKENCPGQFPGLFIFTGPARMMRPVINLSARTIEYIGTFEQIFLDICITPDEAYPGITTHQEIRQTSFLSNLACTIPLPDFNQSPRNMYQCQMGKQTMATPTHTWHLNSETKIYRLQTPTSPFFRPAHYDYIGLDDYAMGTNAIVAVISYTGYDMEDAMIINKSSFERGFCAGSIYKAQFVDLMEISTGGRRQNRFASSNCELIFERDPKQSQLNRFLDADGLPYPGVPLRDGDPLYCYRNTSEGTFTVKCYEGKETVFIDSVKLCSDDTGMSSEKTRVSICFRVPRNPSVGDKFASRAGQKGILSQKWIGEDLPWTETGLCPDIVFNPHGFPSRMTIAMMIECMAGKSGAVHGVVHDATPFTFSEHDDNDAIDYFGKQLEAAGYNYYGTETMYSGTDGVEMNADIFFGVIHYQRLRHMVSDKFQVRSLGAVDQVTRQPIKGRRRGGGVRFGEMERDALLAHGSMYLLQDRLFHGSDKTRVKICVRCGSLLSPRVSLPTNTGRKGFVSQFQERLTKCVICESYENVKDIELPYIFLHLVSQLAAVNIKIKIETSHQ